MPNNYERPTRPWSHRESHAVKKRELRRSQPITQRANATPLEYLKIMEKIYRDMYNHLKLPNYFDEDVAAALDEHKGRMAAIIDKEHLIPGSKMSVMTNTLLLSAARAASAQAILAIRAARWISYQDDHIGTGYTSKAADTTLALLFSHMGPGPHQMASEIVVQWQRYYEIAHTFGWRYLSALVFSATFRQFALEAPEQKWVEWLNYADDARLSIEIFSAFYCPEWRTILRRALGGLDYKLFLTNEELVEYDGHHHLWAFTIQEDKVTSVERIDTYEVIDKAILRTGSKGSMQNVGPDPRNMIVEQDAKFCVVCGHKICECPTYVWSPCLVEIINSGGMGFGVRALQTIEARQLVGEYVGELVRSGHSLYPQDNYMLRGQAGDGPINPKDQNYYVTSKKKGNWTRFVNHGCLDAANCRIDHHVLRGRTYAVYIANRRIEMYEQLTVDYGPGYWEGSSFPCLCSSKVHYTDGGVYL